MRSMKDGYVEGDRSKVDTGKGRESSNEVETSAAVRSVVALFIYILSQNCANFIIIITLFNLKL